MPASWFSPSPSHPMQKDEEQSFRNVGRNARTGARLSLGTPSADAFARASWTAKNAFDRGSGSFPSRQTRTRRDRPETPR